MVTEIVLEDYPEDPVNLIRITRKAEERTDRHTDEKYTQVICTVEHIVESRGSEDVIRSWEVETFS